MISSDSRYSTSTIVTATNLDGIDILAIVFTEPQDTTINFRNHIVAGSDSIESLANAAYSDPALWWVIANANPEILDFSSLESGQVIRIPLLPGLVP